MTIEISGLRLRYWRRGSESNRRIRVLQTLALPLGYRADWPILQNTASGVDKSIFHHGQNQV